VGPSGRRHRSWSSSFASCLRVSSRSASSCAASACSTGCQAKEVNNRCGAKGEEVCTRIGLLR
jgi:hypothetical protein